MHRKCRGCLSLNRIVHKFQFPSNGKVHRKLHSPRRSQRQKRVSIPFKRESASKVRKKLFPATSIRYRAKTCFNSLQTGKCIESKYCFMHEVPHIVVFQFPSNGKVHRKSEKVVFRTIQLCFNSLQTGKCIKRKPSNRLQRPAILFQFPSNGKVHRKMAALEARGIQFERFQFPSNGKVHRKGIHLPRETRKRDVSIPFKRESASKVRRMCAPTPGSFCFNSLQNGKVHRKWKIVGDSSIRTTVSIPFKRESASKVSRIQPHRV